MKSTDLDFCLMVKSWPTFEHFAPFFTLAATVTGDSTTASAAKMRTQRSLRYCGKDINEV